MPFNPTMVKAVLWRNLLERMAAAEDQYDIMEQPLNKALRHVRLNVFPDQLQQLLSKKDRPTVQEWKPIADYVMNPRTRANVLVKPIADEVKNTQIYGEVTAKAFNPMQKKEALEMLVHPPVAMGQQYTNYINNLPFSSANQYDKVAQAGVAYMMKDEATFNDLFSKISIMEGRARFGEGEIKSYINFNELKQAVGKNASNFFVEFNSMLSRNAIILGVAEVFIKKYKAAPVVAPAHPQGTPRALAEPVGVQASVYAKYASTSFKSSHTAAMMTYSVVNRYLDKI